MAFDVDEEIRLLEEEIARAEARMAPDEDGEEGDWDQAELDEVAFAQIASLRNELELWRAGDVQAAIAAYVNRRVWLGNPASLRGKEIDLRSGKVVWE